MPIYEYKCEFCNRKFQLLQKVDEEPPNKCPNCGREGGVKKLISQTMFELKGSGWYATDYKNTSPQVTESKNTSVNKSSEKSQTKEEKSA